MASALADDGEVLGQRRFPQASPQRYPIRTRNARPYEVRCDIPPHPVGVDLRSTRGRGREPLARHGSMRTSTPTQRTPMATKKRPAPAGRFFRQHRTIWQEHSAKDFASYESYKRAGILYVFPPFITARMGQKIGRRPQTQLCGDAFIQIPGRAP